MKYSLALIKYESNRSEDDADLQIRRVIRAESADMFKGGTREMLHNVLELMLDQFQDARAFK